MRAAVLVAVSTPKQAAADKASLDNQLAACRAEVERRESWTLAAEYVIPGRSRNIRYLDEAESAIPELRAFLEAVRTGKYDLVVVPDFDRMARTRALSVQVLEYLKEHRVQSYSLTQPAEPVDPAQYDPHDNDTAVIMESIGGLKSQLDNAARRRRVIAGREAKARRGEHQTLPPFGYMLSPEVGRDNGHVKIVMRREPHPDEAVTWRYLWRLAYEYDLSDRAIAAILNGQRSDPNGKQRTWPSRRGAPWGDSTIARCLTNPFYAGLTRYRYVRNQRGRVTRNPPETVIWAESQSPALVARAEWEALQERRHRKATIGGRAVSATRNPLAGLVKCGLCGAAMYPHRESRERRGDYNQLRCGLWDRAKLCEKNPISLAVLIADVNRRLFAYIAQGPTVEPASDDSPLLALRQSLARKERDLAKIPDRRVRQYRDREEGILSASEYIEVRNALRDEEQRLQAEVLSLRAEIDGYQERAARQRERLRQMGTLHEDIESGDVEHQKRAYRATISRVLVNRGKVTIELAL